MFFRIFRALKLDVTLYEEVEEREDLNIESWLIILAICLVNAFFVMIFFLFTQAGFWETILTVISTAMTFIISFLVSVSTIWVVGSKIFGGMASFGELRRSFSYANLPLLFGWIPCINILVIFWYLATSFVAVRQSMDISNGRTIVVILVASFLAFIPMMCLLLVGSSFLSLGASLFQPLQPLY